MRTAMSLIVATMFLAGCYAADDKATEDTGTEPQNVSAEEMTTEVGCGSCIYDMPGVKGCPLAAKIDGKAMLVTGVSVDAHGLGLCKKAKEAVVAGSVEGDKFVATKVDVKK